MVEKLTAMLKSITSNVTANCSCELPPPEFICPLSKELMADPVAIETGRVYERSAIESWFAQGQSQQRGGRGRYMWSFIPLLRLPLLFKF